MHFNDLHLFVDNFHSFAVLQGYEFHSLIVLNKHMVGVLWDVKTLESYISKTIYCYEICRGYFMGDREHKY